ncbi:MAG: DnaB-like helicase C-terminal domain-containing protein [Desulfobulbaceae bacterium]|jgi:replicative DNA helicase|nr:DnaB-like helicase C-terminal domain-containing protein [Desulfobulbaceae bacterium]
MKHVDAIAEFYHTQLPDAELKNNILQAPCPFCAAQAAGGPGRLVVVLNPQSFFHGYFRCLNRCVPGGFPLHFARLRALNMMTVPGYDPDREYDSARLEFPVKNINGDIRNFTSRMTDEQYDAFQRFGVSREVLAEMQIGYNGRYLVYPYIEDDGNCYVARCIHPDRPEDTFWFGDEQFAAGRNMVFNRGEIDRCENGTLIIVENENNLLTLKQLGLPGIAVPSASSLEQLEAAALQWLNTVFLWIDHSSDSERAARILATNLGFKARLVRWPAHTEKNYSLVQLAVDQQKNFQATAFRLINEARAFSPFSSAEKEFIQFHDRLAHQSGEGYRTMLSGFSLLDEALDGIHGINILGGTPKSGKSCFFIQVATEMARRKIPVIYYDFENGRQKIYQRTLCRLARLSAEQIQRNMLTAEEIQRLQAAKEELRLMLPWFKVVTDRKLTPQLMRRHIDFLRHETKNHYTLVVIDSLHKLPFKDFSERRTGIDAWLRQLEAIRDELNVSFLVISELSRGKDDMYDLQPHLGSFKGTGDIEYSADNAMVLVPAWDPFDSNPLDRRFNSLWLVASRENSPGKIADYRLDYPYWGFEEKREVESISRTV